ncbi:MAG: SRPBCC domain-containing protein [Chitinophagaceae bacterium]|nr:SRPBCC domain-containing protein [Chitinophagaceae bacterium]
MESFIKTSVEINAPIATVWDALINPDRTEQYMFGCRVVSDWSDGATVNWVGKVEGNEVTFVKGFLVAFVPEKSLVYTVVDPNAPYADNREDHLTVSCELSETPGGTLLLVSQGDYSKVADGPSRYGHGVDGWNQLLETIKIVAER